MSDYGDETGPREANLREAANTNLSMAEALLEQISDLEARLFPSDYGKADGAAAGPARATMPVQIAVMEARHRLEAAMKRLAQLATRI